MNDNLGVIEILFICLVTLFGRIRKIMAQTKANNSKMKNLRGKKKKYYDALMLSRDQFTGQMKFHSSEALVNNSNAGETGMSTHMADLGSDNALHDMELAMITNEGNVVELIDEAIERLFNDTYGVCMDCSKQVSEDRLEAKPYARFCIACKTIRENNGGIHPEYS